MALAIRRGESMKRAVRRMARRELEKARVAWGRRSQPMSDRVHDVRAAIKKVRGVIRLVEPRTRRRARRAERRLQDLAAALGPVRDAHIVLATYDELTATAHLKRNRHARRVRRQLRKLSNREVHRPRTRKVFERVDEELRRARRRVDSWTPRSGQWRAIADGLEATYRDARRAIKRAYSDPSGATFHAWRRALKSHLHQARALQALWPRTFDAQIAELAQVDDILGREHDLTLLEETLEAQRACFTDEEHCARLLAELEQRRERLRKQARAPGERLFAEKPRALRRRVHRYFKAFLREPAGIATRALDTTSPQDDGVSV